MADRYELIVESRGITLRGTIDISQAKATKQLTDAKAGLLRQLRAISGLRVLWLGSVNDADGTVIT